MSAQVSQLEWYLARPDIEILMSGLGKSSILENSKSNLGHDKNRDLRIVRSRFFHRWPTDEFWNLTNVGPDFLAKMVSGQA